MLEVESLACLKGDRLLFRDLAFRLQAGGLLRVAGPNGVGKTSLLRLVTGLALPEAGEIRWRGESIRRAREAFHGDLLYLGHAAALNDLLSPLENLRFACAAAGDAVDAEDCVQALQRIGLADQLDLPARVRRALHRARRACGRRSRRHALAALRRGRHGDAHHPPGRALRAPARGARRRSLRMLSTFLAVLRRDLLLAWRGRADVLVTLAFFIIVVCLFPFGVGAEPNQLRAIAPGVLWVAALLACLLSLHRLFAQDYSDGTLEQLLLSSEPAALWVMAKVLAFWLSTGLPVVAVAPAMGLLLDLEQGGLPVLILSLLLGTPILALLGAVGAALTLGLRGGGMLLALLVLPLFVPVLIFGAGAVEAELSGSGAAAHLLLLGGGLAGALALAPVACAAALRISTD